MFPPPWNVSWVSRSLAYFRHMPCIMPLEKSSWTLNVKWHFYHSPFSHSFFFLIALFDTLHSFHLSVHCLLLQPECKFHEGRELFSVLLSTAWNKMSRVVQRSCSRNNDWMSQQTLFVRPNPIASPHSEDLNSLWRVTLSIIIIVSVFISVHHFWWFLPKQQQMRFK